MRCLALGGILIAACARAPVPQPTTAQTAVIRAAPVAECYSLAYSDPRADAKEGMFPTWIALLPPARAEAGNLPGFLLADAKAYKGWRSIGADSLRVMFTGTAEGVDLQLSRADSGVVGRAVWVTDLVGLPQASMHVVGTRQSCPPRILSAKSN